MRKAQSSFGDNTQFGSIGPEETDLLLHGVLIDKIAPYRRRNRPRLGNFEQLDIQFKLESLRRHHDE